MPIRVCVMVGFTAKHAYCSIVLFPIYRGEPIIQSTCIKISSKTVQKNSIDMFLCKDCRRNGR